MLRQVGTGIKSQKLRKCVELRDRVVPTARRTRLDGWQSQVLSKTPWASKGGDLDRGRRFKSKREPLLAVQPHLAPRPTRHSCQSLEARLVRRSLKHARAPQAIRSVDLQSHSEPLFRGPVERVGALAGVAGFRQTQLGWGTLATHLV